MRTLNPNQVRNTPSTCAKEKSKAAKTTAKRKCPALTNDETSLVVSQPTKKHSSNPVHNIDQAGFRVQRRMRAIRQEAPESNLAD
mmetsp:Transcript_66447/g.167485  ORF Transcript_66447/g.167485 Transcript_66447/m.167485 type:complete len:85 (+) Transcript_66447:2364-2618(+)